MTATFTEDLNMNTKACLALAALVPFSFGVAEAHGSRYAMARVVAVEPVYETVVVETPVTSCP